MLTSEIKISPPSVACVKLFSNVQRLSHISRENSFDSLCFGNSLMQFGAELRVESEACYVIIDEASGR